MKIEQPVAELCLSSTSVQVYYKPERDSLTPKDGAHCRHVSEGVSFEASATSAGQVVKDSAPPGDTKAGVRHGAENQSSGAGRSARTSARPRHRFLPQSDDTAASPALSVSVISSVGRL